ncbi:hypothetical protein HMN09_01333200 [Mycena chlorophos]|uniref:Uncharacterized protein n=1 Tax=Mycena chlorophos TaxID=658473 RepID=A0A8H6RY05_MYCCL|nr:hypothetical protein HMN09_01333200 [Mycena chlorophos]
MATYHPSMRLGMGFNSIYPRALVAQAEGPQQANQQVHSTAKFISRYTELLEALGISGPAYIKNISAEGPYSKFLDLKSFREHHIHYLIRVLATRQEAAPPNAELTELDIIPNLSDEERNSIYGDSFISGFNEGGELTALISIKLDDPSDADVVTTKRKIEEQMKLVLGTASKLEDDQPIGGETKLTVLKRCGGVPDARAWTLAALGNEVMGFPQRAFEHPVRLSPILSKYTTLKSYHVANKFTVPQYVKHGAHVYAEALLEVYVEYQAIIDELQQTIVDVEQSNNSLEAQVAVPELVQFFADAWAAGSVAKHEDADSDYDHAQDTSNNAPVGRSSSRNTDRERNMIWTSKWLNGLSPYPATALGLEQARLDCRAEMIRIVDQVDMIADEPDLVSTFGCFWKNRTPATVRKLLPTVTNLVQERLEAEKESARAAELSRSSDELKQREEEQRLRADRLRSEKETALERISQLEAHMLETPYAGWCPVKLSTPIRLVSVATNKSLDYDYISGSHNVQQWDSLSRNPNQKFELISESTKGYFIRHCSSGRYLGPGRCGAGDVMVYMEFNEFPFPFMFECLEKSTAMIHFAERPNTTLNVEGGAHGNGVKLIGWKGQKRSCDQWRVEAF